MAVREQRVAIVTGGSRGIGRRIAERLAQEGFGVVVDYASGQTAAEGVVAGIVASGGTAIAVQADVSDEAAVDALFSAAEQEFGGIDVLVHAAALLTTAPLVDLATDEIDRLLRTNLRGTLVINRLAAKSIRPGGAIVNISSAITKTLAPGYTVYGATKAGVETITTILARELKGRDITVNAVAPGPTETEMFLADLTNSDNGKAMRQGLVDAVPLERIGTPDDIAEVVLALAGPVRWVNGQTIHASGGLI